MNLYTLTFRKTGHVRFDDGFIFLGNKKSIYPLLNDRLLSKVRLGQNISIKNLGKVSQGFLKYMRPSPKLVIDEFIGKSYKALVHIKVRHENVVIKPSHPGILMILSQAKPEEHMFSCIYEMYKGDQISIHFNKTIHTLTCTHSGTIEHNASENT